MYAKHEAIDHGKGRCDKCGRNVERILIGDRRLGGNREWRVVDPLPSGNGWLPHTCPTKPEAGTMRRAA